MTQIQNNQMMTELNIEGMSCGHCVAAVEKALRGVPGVELVTVSLEEGRAAVQGNAEQAAMIAAVAEEGYVATPAGMARHS
ncbi:Heavy metal transport/detoxification protein (plasmid) [Deinococcus proteolyticus MRP]|uniref:Heavy metal transport/detoxification protein n=1 Tax=Deinococcus proteolyticus (strain ATCC 35074 / DSM 20540 / JCM 6276 / NBRC 101906 / NCIMB 13154 / VKM Ac-1939 / CCM 2703 / MRP) TaxID=693977 RepID=F0RPX9_DEIPM|nr:Heavy metal transport/detoxification protein [Deinococcus proteolyticus MRP]